MKSESLGFHQQRNFVFLFNGRLTEVSNLHVWESGAEAAAVPEMR